MNSPVDKIKERLTIEDVVSSYIKLERSGVNLKARCPFHNEKTPSFFVSPSRESYYCFGCGASGDIFTFVEEFEGLDFKGALKMLANRAGVSLPAYTYDKKKEDEKERLYQAHEVATDFFVGNLGKEVLVYLKSRGLKEETIKDFKIGFAKDDWRELYNYLKQKGFSDIEIEKAGLAIKSEKGFYDRFRGRIMFPISDSSGRVIAFSGRIFKDDGKSGKYINSPETPIFKKSAVLYGLDRAKESIRKNNFSILVEGQMDLILSHQAGYRNTVATSGTALSDSTETKDNVVSNLGLIRRLSENIVLAFDGDEAGLNASRRAGKIALALGMDVKVVSIPEGVDPADLIAKQGILKWKETIKSSKHIIEFLLESVIQTSGKDSRKLGREIKDKILPFVHALESAIEKSHFLRKISTLSGIPESALGEDLKKVPARTTNAVQSGGEKDLKKEVQKFRKDYIERKLAGIAFWRKDKELEKTLGEVIEKYKDSKGDLIFEAEVFYEGGKNLEKDVAEMLLNLKEEYLKEELAQSMRELYLTEEGKQTAKTPEILKKIKEINEAIQNIKNNRLQK
ncbi:DNA primase [Candidatus Nomurabacteria bacterium RIFCSPLOWO2_12_FULL_44_11]|uniref:DNA primase n=1 Tax=Candidatus Nomurabacteria bacterium RIFCSPLOWO2_12_FULL_44_11 TaxID=1801796 RepID=A0A1F6Y5Z1_9BACT|nr:MAG: DNA primase [Candidatus Nomurabacteria bacterium RIFCSPHIGHO2_12_FULL_44_22b]OGJ01810.1 MAG: DNA primase [Candidatus Nomurabacteria bacterium RIFCSPLOWO2_12_FULL_44_11]